MKYKFEKIISLKKDKDGKKQLTGAFSPFTAMQIMAKENEWKLYRGGIRVDNNQSNDSTYDHLMIRPFDNCFLLFVDKGIEALPVAMYFSDKKDCIFTPIYKSETTLEKMMFHLENMERPVRKGTKLEDMPHPIMILDEEMAIELFKQALECDLWLKKEDYA